MISYVQALEIISSLPCSSEVTRMNLNQALGRTLAESVTARIPSPPFNNSAMDGYVCRWSDLTKGPLKVAGTLKAQLNHGQSFFNEQGPGTCLRITTGSPIPSWADTVVPHELVKVRGDQLIEPTSSIRLGEHIRKAGEDLAEGESILTAGTRLDPERIMLAAAFGYDVVPVVAPPRIIVATSGDEIVNPGSSLPFGGIFNSNSYFLQAAINQLGLAPAHQLHLEDRLDAAVMRLREVITPSESTLIITTGAVSAGDTDFIPALAQTLGFEILFHKVAVRPGKPVMLARRDNHTWLGLPGNPLATCTGWYYFGRPVLSVVAGLPQITKRTVECLNDITKPEGLRCFYRGQLSENGLRIHPKQGSAHFSASINSNTYVELPEGHSIVRAGTKLQALTL